MIKYSYLKQYIPFIFFKFKKNEKKISFIRSFLYHTIINSRMTSKIHDIFSKNIINLKSKKKLDNISKNNVVKLFSNTTTIEILPYKNTDMYSVKIDNIRYKLGFKKDVIYDFLENYLDHNDKIIKLIINPITYIKCKNPYVYIIDFYNSEDFFEIELEEIFKQKSYVHIDWSHLSDSCIYIEGISYSHSIYEKYIDMMINNKSILYGEFKSCENLEEDLSDTDTVEMLDDVIEKVYFDENVSNMNYVIEQHFNKLREIISNNLTVYNHKEIGFIFRIVRSYLKWKIFILKDQRFNFSDDIPCSKDDLWYHNLLKEIHTYYN